ncbi:MAG: AAA family ATPase [Gammaproteobacteria bacterium]|nr:AAA family ATPase [Gammaproteobacteria bacterium]
MLTVIGNLKGGTGKSTVAFNLAVWLAHEKPGVRVFDLDPQETLIDTAEIREEDGYEPLIEVSNDIDELERLVNSNSKKKEPQILADVSATNMADLKRAIYLAKRILIPVQPSQADIWSTQRFLKMVLSSIDKKKKPEILGFINRADTHIGVRETGEAEEALQLLPNIEALGTRLYQRTAYRRSFSEGLAVFEQDPMGKAAREMKKLAKLLYL